MKVNRVIVLLCFFLVLGACVPKPPVPSEPFLAEVEDNLFIAAEEMFAAGYYPEALDAYSGYVDQYPERPLAPAALMKIAKINSILEKYDEARWAYMRLISQYPRSSFNPDAHLGILYSYYQEGNYTEVIERASDVLRSIDSQYYVFQTYALVGDAYMALESPTDALKYYMEARQRATEFEQEFITHKIKASIARMDPEKILRLIDVMDEEELRAFLMFQLGLNYAIEEKYDDALVALENFLDRFPEHENASWAEDLLKQIKQSALFNRYTIGCLLPLSGPYQAVGHRAMKGIELAMDWFSAQTGGPQMNIVIKDSGGNPDQTRMAMQELINAKVAAIIGPIVTAEVAAVEAQENSIPIITLTQKDNIASIGDYVFRNFITPEMQVKTIADFTTASLGLNRFAILYPDETYGITFMNLFWDRLIENGGKVVGLEAYNPEHTDFADPIKKLVGLYYQIPEDLKEEAELSTEEEGDSPQEARADSDQPFGQDSGYENQEPKNEKEEEPEAIVDFDAIFIPDSPRTAGLIIPQLAFYDVRDVYLLGTNLWHSDALIKMAPQYVQGAIMPDGFFTGSAAPAVQAFVKKFEDTYEEKPGFIEAIVYDSAMMLFSVLAQPDLRFKSELKNELLDLDGFSGITGPTYFDENGEAQKQLYLLQIKGRRFVELEK
ncbi:MAG: penicillin-binding protein activator [Desulfobacterales bacterium]|jgi:ABC-type branched-subunit amino acid transport system substrate-binding protein